MATYYIKNGGNDGADGLSDANAWETLSKVTSTGFSAGDFVYFRRGDTWRERMTPGSASGSSGNVITMGAYGTGADPIIRGSDLVTGWSDSGEGSAYSVAEPGSTVYAVWEDGTQLARVTWDTNIATTALAMSSGTFTHDTTGNVLYVWSTDDADPDTHAIEVNLRDGWWTNARSYITVEDLHFDKCDSGVFLAPSATQVTNITFNRCTITNAGREGFALGGSNPSFANAEDVTINGCIITNWFRDTVVQRGAIVADEGSGAGGDNLIVRNCTITGDLAYGAETNAGRNGIIIRTGDNTLIENNTITGCDHGIEIDSAAASGSAGKWTIRYNLIHDTADDGIWLKGDTASPTTGEVYYNVLYRNSDQNIDLQGKYGTVYNNVFHSGGSSSENIRVHNAGTTGTVKNNIISEWGLYAIAIAQSATAAEQTFDNNLYYDSGGGTFGDIETVDRAFAYWQGTLSQDASGLNEDPLFTDPDNDSFRLASESPCIDTGTDVSLVRDLVGGSLTGTPDMGAYEYSDISFMRPVSRALARKLDRVIFS